MCGAETVIQTVLERRRSGGYAVIWFRQGDHRMKRLFCPLVQWGLLLDGALLQPKVTGERTNSIPGVNRGLAALEVNENDTKERPPLNQVGVSVSLPVFLVRPRSFQRKPRFRINPVQQSALLYNLT